MLLGINLCHLKPIIYVGVGMGVGKAKIDKKWRITLPAAVRKGLKPGDEVIVEERCGVIIIRKAIDLLEEFKNIKLYVKDKELVKADASEAKHVYGALKE